MLIAIAHNGSAPSISEDFGGPVWAVPGGVRAMTTPALIADQAVIADFSRLRIDYRSGDVMCPLVPPIWRLTDARHPASPKNGLAPDQEVDANVQ